MQSLDIVQTVRQVDTPYLSTFPGNFPVPSKVIFGIVFFPRLIFFFLKNSLPSWDLWWYITGYTLVVCAGVFFIAGCFAARTVRSGKRWLWLILPFSFCVIGGLIGFLVGLIPGILKRWRREKRICLNNLEIKLQSLSEFFFFFLNWWYVFEGGLIAAIYVSIPYSIGKDVAFWLGFAQSIMITYFQFGRGEYVIGVSQMMPWGMILL